MIIENKPTFKQGLEMLIEVIAIFFILFVIPWIWGVLFN